MKDEVLIIGCGEIGTSLIDGWLNNFKKFKKRIYRINVLEKSLKRQQLLKKKYKKKIYLVDSKKKKGSKKKFKYVFLSFKPKDLNNNLHIYKNLFDKNTIFYSLLAGKKLSDIKTFFPTSQNIIRLMLNTSISVNMGTVIFYSLKKTNSNELFLLKIIGKVYELKNENLLNLFTALIGSGPVYFYYLLEAMEKAAISHGIQKIFAKKIIKQMYSGTAKMIEKSEKSFKDFRKSITSKGGTTEEAINTLKKNNFEKTVNLSIKNSLKKAKILSLKK